MIETLVALGHRIGMQATIEGVEMDIQARLMSEVECDQCRGFLLGQPIPAEDTAAKGAAAEKKTELFEFGQQSRFRAEERADWSKNFVKLQDAYQLAVRLQRNE